MRVYLEKLGVNSKSLEFFFSRPAESFRTRLVLDAPYFLLDASHYSIIPHYSSSYYRDIDKKMIQVFLEMYSEIPIWEYMFDIMEYLCIMGQRLWKMPNTNGC